MMTMLQTVLVSSLIQFCLGATISNSSVLEDPLHCQLLLPQNPELPWLRFLSDACKAHYQCSLNNTNAAGHCNQEFLKDMSDRCKDGFSDAFYDECQKSAANLYHKVVVAEEVNFLHSRSLKQTSLPGNIVDFDQKRLFDDCGLDRIDFTIIFKNDGQNYETFKVLVTQNGKHLFEEVVSSVPPGQDRQVNESTTSILEGGTNEVELQILNDADDWITVDTDQRDIPKNIAPNFDGQIIEIYFDLFIQSINARVQNTGNTVADYYIKVPDINKESEREQFCKGEEKTLSISLDSAIDKFVLLGWEFIVELYVDPKDETAKKVDSGSYR